jgi:hypothetical protein
MWFTLLKLSCSWWHISATFLHCYLITSQFSRIIAFIVCKCECAVMFLLTCWRKPVRLRDRFHGAPYRKASYRVIVTTALTYWLPNKSFSLPYPSVQLLRKEGGKNETNKGELFNHMCSATRGCSREGAAERLYVASETATFILPQTEDCLSYRCFASSSMKLHLPCYGYAIFYTITLQIHKGTET